MPYAKENGIPLYIYDDYDPKKQEEWIDKQMQEKIKNKSKVCENIDFDINKDLLIDDVLL